MEGGHCLQKIVEEKKTKVNGLMKGYLNRLLLMAPIFIKFEKDNDAIVQFFMLQVKGGMKPLLQNRFRGASCDKPLTLRILYLYSWLVWILDVIQSCSIEYLPSQEQAFPFTPCNSVSRNILNRRSKPTRHISPLAAFATHRRTYAVVLIRHIDALGWALVRLRRVDNPLLNVRS